MILEQFPPSIFHLTLFILSISTHIWGSCSQQPQSIYQILKSNGLPMGLFPKGVTNFNIDDSGKFQVFLDQDCNAKFEDELHYDRNVSGSLTFGRINELSGISAKDLFLWFLVKEIWVDTPNSGLIHFDVGVVSKQFSLASFECPRDCLTSSVSKAFDIQFIKFDDDLQYVSPISIEDCIITKYGQVEVELLQGQRSNQESSGTINPIIKNYQ